MPKTQHLSPRNLSPQHVTIHDTEADFVLFPTSTDHHQTHRPARRQTERAPATSRIAPNLRVRSTSNGQQLHRQFSTQQSPTGSPLQNPRVNDLIGLTSTASSTSLQRSSPTGQPKSHDLYSSSAPSSSISLHQSSHSRPQVPLFLSNSTGSLRKPGPQDKFGYRLPEGRCSRTMSDASKLTSLPETSSNPNPPKTMFGPSYSGSYSGSYPSGTGFQGTNPTGTSSSELTTTSEDYSPGSMSGSMSGPSSFNHDLTLMPDLSPEDSYFNANDLAMELAHFNSIHSTPASNSVQTISPSELNRVNHEFMTDLSAPPSTAFTNLTTPGSSYVDFGIGSTETSPMFDDLENVGPEAEWPSLFPPDLVTEPPTRPANALVAPKMSRNASSGQSSSRQSRQSHQSHSGRHSFSAGVRPSRRERPLPVINVDPNDEKAVKRARNTMAARKSRKRKVARTEELLDTIARLEKKVEKYKTIALARGHIETETEMEEE